MGEFFFNYGLFFAKLLTLVIAIGIVIVLISSAGGRGKREKGSISITRVNEAIEHQNDAMRSALLDPEYYKESLKKKKKQDKAEAKARKAAAKIAAKKRGDGTTVVDEKKRKRKFVLDFDGDIRASQVRSLRREITAVLAVADPFDEVVLRLESGGGTVHGLSLIHI